MNASNIKIEVITLIKQSSSPRSASLGRGRRRMLRVISETDYERENTKKFGFIFGILDINLGQAQNTKIFNIINEGISRYYTSSLEYDIAFDDMINFLNRRMGQFISPKDLKEKCDILIGVFKDKKIFFCAGGKTYAYFIHPQGIKKVFPEEESALDVSDKMFSYSLTGEMLENHTLYFCNSDFNMVVNPHHLGKSIKEHGAHKIIAALRDSFLHQESERQYNALFIYHLSESDKDKGSAASIEKLFKKEQGVADILSPSVLNYIKQNFKQGSLLTHLFTYLFLFLKKIFHLLKTVVLFVAFLLFNLFFIITNIRGKRREKQLMVNNRFRNILSGIANFYKALTPISKAILIGIIFLILALSAGIGYNLHLQNIKQLKISYKAKIENAKNLYNEADADLLFQEKNIAVKKLKKALVGLQDVPSKIHDKPYKELFKKIKERLYKVQNISEINQPVLIADFSLEKDIEIYPPLYIYENKINILSQNQIINIDVKNQNIKRNSFVVKGLANGLSYYFPAKKTIYSFENEKTLQITDTIKLTSEIKEAALHHNENIKKFAVYNDKMYVISSSDKYFSIWKHSPSLSGFGKPTLWATDNLPENANLASFAIDGSLYLLFSNNQILKYYRGNKAKWSYDVESIDKNIEYNKIITNDEYKYLYLLGKNRVSILSKNGEFLGHFLLPSLNDMKDVAVNEGTKTIYVLDGKKIYAFSYQL